MMQANTGVRFETKDPLLSQLVKQAEEKCRLNIKNFGGDPVLVEGGGYEKIWLETQPMGGAMYASRDFATGLNNSLMFMRHQRADGRIPGSIAVIDGKVVPQFNKFQGFCFPEPALDLYYLGGKDAEYLAQLAKTLKRLTPTCGVYAIPMGTAAWRLGASTIPAKTTPCVTPMPPTRGRRKPRPKAAQRCPLPRWM